MKRIIKTTLNFYSSLLSIYYILLSKLVGFEKVVFRISTIPYQTGNCVRYKFYKNLLSKLGENVVFSFGTVITNKKTTIGSNVRLGPYNSVGWASIGNDVLTAQYVHFLSGSNQHSFDNRDVPIINQPGTICRLIIEGNNWFGANVVIMNNIGKGSIIGSGSIVVTPVGEMKVAAGNPCKIIKERP